MPFLSSMMKQACTLTFLPVFVGTLANGPAHWMKQGYLHAGPADEHGEDIQ